jgi:predicted PurR-regulated permease PerM
MLLRQLIEPKIMGENLGLHPLLNLAAVYAGYSFFGVTGVVFLPISVVIFKNLLLPEKR